MRSLLKLRLPSKKLDPRPGVHHPPLLQLEVQRGSDNRRGAMLMKELKEG
jgi:hypothetical protein